MPRAIPGKKCQGLVGMLSHVLFSQNPNHQKSYYVYILQHFMIIHQNWNHIDHNTHLQKLSQIHSYILLICYQIQ